MNRAARTARFSIFSNTVLIALKLTVGLLSGSVSIISEAIHSLMDLFAAVMAFFSIRLARRPADRGHPYGHEKIENVSGVIEAILIISVVVVILDTYFGPKGILGGNPGLGFLKQLTQSLDSSTTVEILRKTTIPFVLAILGPLLPKDVTTILPSIPSGLPIPSGFPLPTIKP